jgi:hypothetical protein
MRKIALTLAAAAGIASAVSLSSNRAEATFLDASAAIRQATEDTSLAQPANYVCRWSYWGRRCSWRPSYDDGYHQPYYRPGPALEPACETYSLIPSESTCTARSSCGSLPAA